MSEKEWVKSIIDKLQTALQRNDSKLRVVDGYRLPYGYEIRSYDAHNNPAKYSSVNYETDILIFEQTNDESWLPRVVIEAKLGSITTHDAITYSQKASAHKFVHPHLRYGILIGNRKDHPLPGRLFRHGQHFDFMVSWKGLRSNEVEFGKLLKLLRSEIRASRTLEKIMYESRQKNRDRYSILHRPLELKK